jgi:MarR family transcriptional regulator, organic hydroperoxide resistance regulator
MPAASLDAMVCFSLYAASHATTQAYRAVLAPWRLTYPQYLVLLAVEDDGCTVGELGAAMMLDSGTLSPLLKRLEARGLLARRRGTADERVVTVSLSDEGRRIRAEVLEAVSCLTPGYRLTANAVPDLLATLHGVREGMQEIAAERR